MKKYLEKFWFGEIVITSFVIFSATFYFIRDNIEKYSDLYLNKHIDSTDVLLFSLICSVLIVFGYIGIRLFLINRKIINSQFLIINDSTRFKKEIKDTKELRIFASGSETYRTHLLSFLQKAEFSSKITIKILIREDGSDERNKKLIEAKQKWFNDIDETYNTKTLIKSYKFSISLRGILFDNKSAMLGWYYRNSKGTQGQSTPVIFHDSKNPNSKKIIDFAIETFDYIYSEANDI